MADQISIIVPVYNVAAALPRCLDSILAQTYPNIEIVAVDDGSPDHAGVILDQYAAKHGNLHVVHKENGGVTSARLRGIQEASGEWIGFVDGDDEIEPDMYERLLKNAKAYDAQISHCGYQMLFPDGRVHYFHNTGLLAKQDKTAAIRELLSGSMIEPGLCNKLFHKSLLHSLLHDGAIDTSIKINEDLLMNFYLFTAAEQTVFEDWCPYHYIVREGSASRAKLNKHMIYDPIKVKEIVRQAVDTNLFDDAEKAYVSTCINAYHILLNEGKVYREDLKKIRELLIRESTYFHLLGKKRCTIAQLITNMPLLYRPIYLFYCRFMQRKIYS